jgi:hypothetical protein
MGEDVLRKTKNTRHAGNRAMNFIWSKTALVTESQMGLIKIYWKK